MLRQGDTFWISSSGPASVEHLHVVISDPEKNADQIVVVPFTTLESWKDDSCIIHRGEHCAVKHDTCVDYRRGDVLSERDITDADKTKSIRWSEAVSKALLERILDGANETKYLPSICDKILADQELL